MRRRASLCFTTITMMSMTMNTNTDMNIHTSIHMNIIMTMNMSMSILMNTVRLTAITAWLILSILLWDTSIFPKMSRRI